MMAMPLNYKTALECSPNAYIALDPNLRIVWANRAFLNAVGRQSVDLIGLNVVDAFPADPQSRAYCDMMGSLQHVLRERKPHCLPLIAYPIRRGDDARLDDRVWSITHTPLLDAAGDVSVVLKHVVDVTDLQRVFEEGAIRGLSPPFLLEGLLRRTAAVQEDNRLLDADRRRLSQLFDQSPAFLAVLAGPDLVFEMANPAYLHLVGRDVLGKPAREALPELDPELFDHCERVFETNTPFVARYRTVSLRRHPEAPPEEVCLNFVFQPITGEDGLVRGILVQGSDCTEERRAIRALQESRARYKLLTESSTDLIVHSDVRGRILYVSPACRDVLGFEPDEFVAKAPLDHIHPDDRLTFLSHRDALVTGRLDRCTFTCRVLRKDGSSVLLELSFRVLRKTDGSPDELISVSRDITERVALEERLRQSQKLEALGRLTGHIAHDFNNLLTVMLGNSELLLEEPGCDDASKLAELICQAAERGTRLTQSLLSFARRQSLQPECLDAVEVLRAMLPLFERTIGEHVRLEAEFDTLACPVVTDRALLESAILNLVVNARDAMPKHGTLTISVGQRTADAGDGSIPSGQPVVSITVTDTGAGMGPDVLDRAFEPFFTTKEAGSGLGLPMVYGFAQQSGGQVTIDSAPGQGTTVTVLLPSGPVGKGVCLPVLGIDQKGIGGAERILVVEDEAAVRAYVCSQLRSLGYSVEAAENGTDALNRLHTDQSFDLLLTDIVLPKGVSGVELAHKARSLQPDLKILLTSGYSEEIFEAHGRPSRDMPLLRKPYRRRELAAAVRERLVPLSD